ncbi:MAG TPA: hypothetical protein ENF62_02055 [Candidatus Bathyarchaeota archaeon]|nr:hypothetical protein [Candidatus Bathyarchaeota archaeon]
MPRMVRDISLVFLAVLLLAAMTVGALLSYMTVAGYYHSLSLKLPNQPSVAITNVTYSPPDKPDRVDVTVLVPTYSPSEANITGFYAIVNKTVIRIRPWPPVPYVLRPGEEMTFLCAWVWWEYSGQEAKIVVVVEGGSGAIVETTVPEIFGNVTQGNFTGGG